MNWKDTVLAPAAKALGLTLAAFAALFVLCAALAAHSIWIEGHHDSKFGDEWGNLRFYMMIFAMVLGVQCGILLVGNAIALILQGGVLSRRLVLVSIGFAVANGTMIALKTQVTNPLFLFAVPIAFAVAAIVLTRGRLPAISAQAPERTG